MAYLDTKIWKKGTRLAAKPRPLDYRGHKCDFEVCPHNLDTRTIYPCSPGYLTDSVHGARRIPRCNKWDCKHCGPGKVYAFEKKVEAYQLFHTRNDRLKNVMLTLTFYAECEEKCNLHWRQCLGQGHRKRAIGARGWETKSKTRNDYWNKFMRRLRDELDTQDGLSLAFIRVKEQTKSGVDHFHAIIGNVDRRHTERYMRNVASRIWNDITGNSFVVDVRNTYGKPQSYLGKYLDKNFPGAVDRGRRFSVSQNAMLPPTAVKAYTINRKTYEHPDGNVTPYMQAFGTSSQFRGYYPEDKPPSGGILESRQACHHEDCEMRLHHSKTRKQAFGDKYDEYMTWYFIHEEDYNKLV